jgi:hypothetical protein
MCKEPFFRKAVKLVSAALKMSYTRQIVTQNESAHDFIHYGFRCNITFKSFTSIEEETWTFG